MYNLNLALAVVFRILINCLYSIHTGRSRTTRTDFNSSPGLAGFRRAMTTHHFTYRIAAPPERYNMVHEEE